MQKVVHSSLSPTIESSNIGHHVHLTLKSNMLFTTLGSESIATRKRLGEPLTESPPSMLHISQKSNACPVGGRKKHASVPICYNCFLEEKYKFCFFGQLFTSPGVVQLLHSRGSGSSFGFFLLSFAIWCLWLFGEGF